MIKPFLHLALSAWCALAHAGAGPWESVRQGGEREDISSWVRSVDGMAVKEFRGVTELHQTTLAVLALLSDIPNLPTWIYQCKTAEQPAGRPGEQTYARFKGVWPASDRDVLMQSTVTQLPDQSVVVESRQAEGYPLQAGHVRMPYLHNTFRLMPLKGGWTRVEFDTQIDLGGLVPTWLANLVATNAPVRTLQGMRQQLQSQPKYQIKSVKELPAYYLKGNPLVMPEGHLAAEAGSGIKPN